MLGLYYEQKAVIRHQKGMHARVAAMVVQKSHEFNTQYQSGLFLKYKHCDKILATSLMLLSTLKIKAGDEVWVAEIKPN